MLNYRIRRFLRPFLIKTLFQKSKKYKNYLNFFLSKRQLKLTNYSVSVKYIYFKTYDKKHFEFYSSLPYNAYQRQFWWIEKKLNNKNYKTLISFTKELRDFTRSLGKHFTSRYKIRRLFVLQNYIYIYNIFFAATAIDLFFVRRLFKNKFNKIIYHLIFSFFKNKLSIILQNSKKKNYTYISPGFFIKFFEKKKSLKKTKALKFLMIKYLRKLLIIARINNAILFIKNSPSHLPEMLKLLNTPIVHKFNDPIDNTEIDESNLKTHYFWVKFLYFIFLKNLSFSKNKERKRGRIKRKILRKLVLENKLID